MVILMTACNQPLQKHTIRITDATSKISGPVSKPEKTDEFNLQTNRFTLVNSFPKISDTLEFIKNLKENCHLEDDVHNNFETISYFKKVKLFGSDKEFYIIEYDFQDGSTAAFPWKHQLVFDMTGKLIKIFSDIRLDLVKIFPKENLFLFGVSSTGHGNGWHQVSKINTDTIENVYTGFLGNRPQTYDRDADNTINEPYEFHYRISDINHDGFNDIVFYGKIVLIQGRTKSGVWYDTETRDGKVLSYSINNPFKKIPVTFVFLYNSKVDNLLSREIIQKSMLIFLVTMSEELHQQTSSKIFE